MLSFVLRMVRILANKLSGNGGAADKSKGLTATAGDIVAGKTAAVNKEIVTGIAKNTASGTIMKQEATLLEENGEIIMRRITNEPIVLRNNSTYRAFVDNPVLGDATEKDVKKGKTFSNNSDVILTGTMDTEIVAEEPSVSVSCSSNKTTVKITTTKPVGELLGLTIFTKSGSSAGRPCYYEYKNKRIRAFGYDATSTTTPTISGNTITFSFTNDLNQKGYIYAYIAYKIGGK